MPENKHLRRGLICLYCAASLLLAWLLLRYALPWLLPFITALLLARLLEPVVLFLARRLRFRRGLAAALCTLVLFCALLGLTSLIIGRTVIELSAFVKDLPTLLKGVTKSLSLIGSSADGYIKSAPADIQKYLSSAFDGLVEKATALPAALSGSVLNLLTKIARFTPKLLLFIFTCALSVFFFSCGYEKISAFLLRQIPTRRHAALRDIRHDLVATFGKWVKAELLLAGITFGEMACAFLWMRIDFALLLALLVAVVDFLPILGSGAVIIPWALIASLSGNFRTAVTLIILFIVNTAVRSILEPKMIGAQLGLPPVATLVAMYVGFCAVGVLGTVLFPIVLIMLKHLNDKSYLRLWH